MSGNGSDVEGEDEHTELKTNEGEVIGIEGLETNEEAVLQMEGYNVAGVITVRD